MTESTRDTLRRALLSAYAELKGRLASRLGSADLAGEALHEMWLKLEQGTEFSSVSNPKAYLYRAALNTAANLRRVERRYISDTDRDIILSVQDEAPDPENIAAGRSDLEQLQKALGDLTDRQRSLFFGYFVDDLDQATLARKHGVSVRTVQADLHAATERIRRSAQKNVFAFRRRDVSSD